MATEIIETPSATERYLMTGLVDEAGALESLANKIQSYGAKITKTEDLGLRRLAFPIAKKSELQLVSVFFEAEPHMIKTIDSQFKHESHLKRFLITTWSVDPSETPGRSRHARVETPSVEEENV